MSGSWHHVREPRVFKLDEYERASSVERRAMKRNAGLCINGGAVAGKPSRLGIVHGPARPRSGKCERCEDVAKRTR